MTTRTKLADAFDGLTEQWDYDQWEDTARLGLSDPDLETLEEIIDRPLRRGERTRLLRWVRESVSDRLERSAAIRDSSARSKLGEAISERIDAARQGGRHSGCDSDYVLTAADIRIIAEQIGTHPSAAEWAAEARVVRRGRAITVRIADDVIRSLRAIDLERRSR